MPNGKWKRINWSGSLLLGGGNFTEASHRRSAVIVLLFRHSSEDETAERKSQQKLAAQTTCTSRCVFYSSGQRQDGVYKYKCARIFSVLTSNWPVQEVELICRQGQWRGGSLCTLVKTTRDKVIGPAGQASRRVIGEREPLSSALHIATAHRHRAAKLVPEAE